MIRSFRNKGLAEFWRTGRAAGIPPELAVRVRNRLTALHRASDLGRLREAGHFRLRRWKGAESERRPIDVSGPWRLTFEGRDGDAYRRVDLEQPHRRTAR